MKLVIYGVSRSGKDYFIAKLIEFFKKNNIILKHIKGSETLNNLALKKYNHSFKSLNDKQKNELRREFIDLVKKEEKETGNIVVDGHFSFYDSQKKLYSVFSEHDLDCYDRFFYLDTDAQDIIQYSKSSSGEKKNDHITVEDVELWKSYEIEHLESILITRNKEPHIIKYQDDFALQYVLDATISDKYNSYKTACELIDNINFDNASTIILTDCDKTLSYEDTTNIALEYNQASPKALKEIFYNDRYSQFQFALANKYYEGVNAFNEQAVEYTVSKTQLNKNIIEDLKSKTDCLILGITAGNTNIWRCLLKKCDLNATILPTKNAMSKYEKLFVASALRKKGKFVISIGDSMLDSLMLKESNIGYIASGKGYRENIDEFLKKNSHIRNLSYFDYKYDCINTDKNICSIKTLTVTDECKHHIDNCKSASNTDGRLLRQSHYALGKMIAEQIKNDFPNESFALIILLRSGIPFGLGIGDYLDCPIIFYDENNKEKAIKEIEENESLASKKFILCDAVINSGASIKNAICALPLNAALIATTVISDKFITNALFPIYSVRTSQNSYVGAKQKSISEGKGPDTSDRLFKLI